MKYLLLVFALYLGSFTACNRGGNASGAQMLPSAQLINATGDAIDLSSFKGKKVFVNLWATWCPPCVEEMPSIQQLYNQTQNSNTEFVMISLDKSFNIAQQWSQQKNYSLPLYFPSADLPELFQVSGIPTTFIFDEEGKLIFSQVGGDNYGKPKFVKMLTDPAQP
jgi:thiol-disulfide isomerase/thioredoxin